MKILVVLMFLGATPLASSQEDYHALEPFVDETAEPDLAVEEEVEEEILGTPVQRLAYSISEFGYDLYRLLASRDPGANVFLSPLSVATSLSALSLGTLSTNKEVLQRILNYESLQDLDVHSVFKDLLSEVTTQPKQFKTVARIYGKKRLRMRAAFMNQVSQFYGFRPKAVTGNVQQDVQSINQWVRSQTGGKISQVISSMPAALSLLLLSAAHYKGQLVTRFNPVNTLLKTFRVGYGQEVDIPMMSSPHYPLRYGYDSELNCKIGLFPYVGDISLLIFLPSGPRYNMTAVEDSLMPVFVHDLVSQLQSVRASVSIPRLTIDTNLELKNVLGEMNLSPLYTPSELKKLTAGPVTISSVTHRASLVLDEEGMGNADLPTATTPQLSLEFHVNQPFILVLYDNPSGSLLHIGRVMDPRNLVTSRHRGPGNQ
ncbi:pigment epithelium-derived factor-like [Pristis pectinata]|uniref:pigment epithelium-derived factor-like n=1 Tax=Pristis pectinata TaxID=685728 RepID=UPI00223E75CA|nr:pigment epithelium-derived factor-like [Pristis pectinata]XP_051891597.1 pigment epithelium-derived factor-like [Pristis pectinata]XP_051891598.1 pigment epithelium-derived factor-like [Pristis pectinata]